MKLVIDANILMAAIIKDGTTTKLLSNNKLKLYAPEHLFYEVEKYKDLILKKTGFSENYYNIILRAFIQKITIISEVGIINFIDKAKVICPDPKDVQYFALALMLNIPIWSNDKKLKEQNKIKVLNTEELILSL